MPVTKPTEKDDHGRVAVLFTLPATDTHEESCIAVSVKWILVHGPPRNIDTGEYYTYSGTHIIQ